MIHAPRPRVFGPKLPFNPRFFTAHQFQNAIVFVFIQPESMVRTAIKFQVKETVIESLQRCGTNRTIEFCFVADNVQRPLVGFVGKRLVFQLIQFGGCQPHSLTTGTSFDFHAAIILCLQLNVALWTFHWIRILEPFANPQSATGNSEMVGAVRFELTWGHLSKPLKTLHQQDIGLKYGPTYRPRG